MQAAQEEARTVQGMLVIVREPTLFDNVRSGADNAMRVCSVCFVFLATAVLRRRISSLSRSAYTWKGTENEFQ